MVWDTNAAAAGQRTDPDSRPCISQHAQQGHAEGRRSCPRSAWSLRHRRTPTPVAEPLAPANAPSAAAGEPPLAGRGSVELVRSMGGRSGSRRRAALQPPRHRHASGQCARVRRRAHPVVFADSSAKSTTKQARARAPMCARRRAQCGPRERPYRAAQLKQAWQIFQNRDAMGSAAPRPSTRTMVLCTGTRGSLVRCPLRQRRPVRAARAAARSLPDSGRFSARTRANLRR